MAQSPASLWQQLLCKFFWNSSHFSKGFFSPFTYTKQTAKGAAMISPQPWRQNKVPCYSFSEITPIMEAYAPYMEGRAAFLLSHCAASAINIPGRLKLPSSVSSQFWLSSCNRNFSNQPCIWLIEQLTFS